MDTTPSDPAFVDSLGRFHKRSARSVARHVAVSSLAALQRWRGDRARALARPRVHFVYLHSVFRDEEAGFRALLSTLAETHGFIGYSEAVERVCRGAIERPLVAISFDDGFKSCLRAARVLEEFGARACFFVCSSIVGETRFDRLRAFCRDRLHTPPVEFLTWDDLEALLRAGHEIGSHTRTHANLAALDGSALGDEIAGSRAELAARAGPIRHFAWPYGRFAHVRPEVASVVARAGYESCASAERGCHVAIAGSSPDNLCLRRDQVVAAWPVAHSLYFLAQSAASASAETNRWPSWSEGAVGDVG